MVKGLEYLPSQEMLRRRKLVVPEDVALEGPNGSFPISTRRFSELLAKLHLGRMRKWSKVEAGSSNYM